jgi:carboxypeptidase Q
VSVGSVQVVAPADGGGERVSSSVRPWATNAPAGPPQIELAAEQYNRLVHMIQAGEKLKMAVEVQTQFQDEDLQCYNTIAEIPGTDRKGELVMLGAHLDSAPGGTGATDNAAGVAVCMEAVRLIQVLKLQPRRTIRIGLWTGEEQGLLGSRAYVTQHFGYYTNQTNSTAVRSPREASQQASGAAQEKPSTRRTLVRRRDYKRLSAYYNLDNGAGRIRGIYLQANEALRAIFRPWLEPFRDLGAETITVSNTGGTDHQSFDAIGLPGFQFIQDPIEYWRSYHNSLDVRERAPTADLQQAAIVMAAFVYNTAVREEKLPRKPLEEDVTGNRGR